GDAGDQLRLRLHNACLLGRSFFDAGFTAVIDDIIIDGRLEQLTDELEGHEFMFIMLAPSLECVREREDGRGSSLYAEWEWLTDRILKSERGGLWIDSSHQAPDETVDEIMRRTWTEASVRERSAQRT